MLGVVRLVRDEKAVSEVMAAMLLMAVVVLAIAAVATNIFGMTNVEMAPNVRLDIMDHPDAINPAATGENAFIIRHMGGDRINYNDIIVAVYDSSGQMIYNSIVSEDPTNLTRQQMTGTAYNDNFFEGGEQIVASDGVLNQAGTYEIAVYYKPTMTLLYKEAVMIS